MWCERKTTWAVIMSSLETQILFLLLFLFQLLSPRIISSECPEKSKVCAWKIGLRNLLKNKLATLLVKCNIQIWKEISGPVGFVEKDQMVCFISVYRAMWFIVSLKVKRLISCIYPASWKMGLVSNCSDIIEISVST